VAEPQRDDVTALATALDERGLKVAVAESLTGGSLSAKFAAGPQSATWYRGAIVSYSSEVKHDLLQVPDGPVVSEAAATAMAVEVCSLLGAHLSVSVTGAGGPDPQDGQPPGTIWMALHDTRDGSTATRHVRLPGSPAEVVDRSCDLAIGWLLERCTTAPDRGPTPGTRVGE
jgi:nicotinamide-nucleotide amidase